MRGESDTGGSARVEKSDGRRLFGLDAAGYDRGRPGHADEVYDILRERCGARARSKVLEVGPGTGQATRRLLDLGADPLVAVEPDPGLAGFLHTTFGDRVEIRASTLEDAELEDDFDLAAAASSFHWVDEDQGLAKLREALQPGGWVALWWTAPGDGNREDAFREAVEPLLGDLLQSPSSPTAGGPPFAHDGAGRVAALERVGFDDVMPVRIEWTHTWDTEGIRGLFGSFSPILALEPGRRETLLDSIAHLADTEFGGRVTKPVVTALYTAQRPS
jgi:SAM-dependent methyltransferase